MKDRKRDTGNVGQTSIYTNKREQEEDMGQIERRKKKEVCLRGDDTGDACAR